jgi:DNA-binding MarR family transcriptional regulator
MLNSHAAATRDAQDAAEARRPTLAEIGLENFAPYLINLVAARWNDGMQERLREHNISTLQMRTLAVLSVMPGATVNELALHTVTEQSTMSRALEGMVREGLVRRQNRRGDMRIRELHLTEKGSRAFQRIWPIMHSSLREMFGALSEEEYETLIALLTRVLGDLAGTTFESGARAALSGGEIK